MKRTLLILALVVVLLATSFIYYNAELEIPELQEEEKIVFINEDDKFLTNNHSNKDYLSVHILEDNMIGITGKSLGEYDSVLLDLENEAGDNLLREDTEIIDGNIALAANLELEEGLYTGIIYFGVIEDEVDGKILTKYVSKMDFKLKNHEGIYTIPRGINYQSNLEYMRNDNEVKKKHLNMVRYNDDEKNRFKKLLEEIILDEEDPYEKAYLISRWVSENIAYNVDGLNEDNYGVTDAIGTLDLGYSVCQGYAELTDALLKTANIPSRLTIGYGLGGSGVENETWEDVDPDETNHIWNEAYINGRWIIIDTTWNSNNKRINGEIIRKSADNTYFDVTIEYFSEKHRIHSRN